MAPRENTSRLTPRASVHAHSGAQYAEDASSARSAIVRLVVRLGVVIETPPAICQSVT
jgi:hypothetical protein